MVKRGASLGKERRINIKGPVTSERLKVLVEI